MATRGRGRRGGGRVTVSDRVASADTQPAVGTVQDSIFTVPDNDTPRYAALPAFPKAFDPKGKPIEANAQDMAWLKIVHELDAMQQQKLWQLNQPSGGPFKSRENSRYESRASRNSRVKLSDPFDDVARVMAVAPAVLPQCLFRSSSRQRRRHGGKVPTAVALARLAKDAAFETGILDDAASSAAKSAASSGAEDEGESSMGTDAASQTIALSDEDVESNDDNDGEL